LSPPFRASDLGIAQVGHGWLNASILGDSMFDGFTRRDVAIGAIAMIVATALTIFGTNYVFHKFVLDDPRDPLTRQGGLKPEQQINHK
jgi:hypothetical protein